MDSVVSVANTACFESIYLQHHSWLYQILTKRLNDNFDAADIAHDVFYKLLLKPKTFNTNKDTRNYLSHIAKGLYIDKWRRKQVEQAYLQSLALQQAECSGDLSVHYEAIETLCQVNNMLCQLPEKVAHTFIYAQLEGLTYKEIASILAVSERTVKNYMAQALVKLAGLVANL